MRHAAALLLAISLSATTAEGKDKWYLASHEGGCMPMGSILRSLVPNSKSIKTPDDFIKAARKKGMKVTKEVLGKGMIKVSSSDEFSMLFVTEEVCQAMGGIEPGPDETEIEVEDHGTTWYLFQEGCCLEIEEAISSRWRDLQAVKTPDGLVKALQQKGIKATRQDSGREQVKIKIPGQAKELVFVTEAFCVKRGEAQDAKSTRGGVEVPFIAAFTPASGYPGQAVTLAGGNLLMGSVKFNGVECRETMHDGATRQLRATIPEGATTGFITVETHKGIAKSDKPFKVLPKP